MRLPAASMPVALLSSPSVARFSISVSASKEVEKAAEEALRDWARARRELVKLLDSASLWARSSACVVSWLKVDMVVSGGFFAGCLRFRNMDMGSSIVGAAAEISAFGVCAAAVVVIEGTAGASSPRISSSSSGP